MNQAPAVHNCIHCGKRLPVANVRGEVTAFCKHCKKTTVIRGASGFREQIEMKA